MKQTINKLERYVSKNQNVPSNLTTTSLNLTPGELQRSKINPIKNELYNLNQNKNRIGINIPQQFNPYIQGCVHNLTSEHNTIRKVTVFQGGCNHMQSTPYVSRGGQWFINWESMGFYRSHAMLWGRCSEDAFRNWGNRYEVNFLTANDAVGFAKSWGWAVDVVYPHERYHQTKAYADNFTFSKEAVDDLEGSDEIFADFEEKLNKI